jgi:hypothetical protein
MILLLVGGPPHGENLADDGEADLLRDRLRLSVVKMATAEGRAPLLLARLALASVDRFLFLMRLTPFWSAQAGRRAGMDVAETVVACVADLAFNSAGLPPRLRLRSRVICSSQLSLPVTNPHLVNCKLNCLVLLQSWLVE